MLRKIMLLAAVFSLPAYAEGADPSLDWHSADTPHFRINYMAHHRAQAERAALHAEESYARITQQLVWQPAAKTELLLLDITDLSNGFSTPLPFNENVLFLTPPDDGQLLHNHNWLEGLITHEFTHTVHMDKVGMLGDLRSIFGRFDLLFPNVVQPTWGLEGIATLNESHPELGQGRLRNAIFEAFMRIERERGFISLAELNADGHRLPTSKQYLYGVYFYDFLNRKYGADAAVRYIQNYSDNIVPMVQSNPLPITGKALSELWEEFIVDLAEQVDARAATLKATPRADGAPLLIAHYNISSISPLQADLLAVLNDGVHGNKLVRINPQGGTQTLAEVRSEAHIDAHPDGRVLIAQPDIVDNYHLYYDLYTWAEGDGIKRLSKGQRYRRAVWAGEHIAALKHAGGVPSLELLEIKADHASKIKTLFAGTDGLEAIDVASNQDGSRVAMILKKNGAWQVVEFDVAQSSTRILFDYDAPMHGLRYSQDGQQLEFIAAKDGALNLWRYGIGTHELTRLSHSYTGVTLHSGVAVDGSVVLGVMAAEGIELRRLAKASTQSTLAVSNSPSMLVSAPVSASPLGEAQNYAALRSLYPRSWFPSSFADRDLIAYGFSTYGTDAMQWHNYSANALWEFSQGEPIGSVSYNYLNRHFFELTRELWAKQWTGLNGQEKTTIYDRSTSAQWVSMQPWLASARRIHLGIGVAQQSTDRVFISGVTTHPQLERVAATFAQYDSREGAWYATAYNRGTFARLLFESYRPFNTYYDGNVLRLDVQKLWPLGNSVVSAHWTEAHASGLTEPFQLGGAYNSNSVSIAPTINQRALPLHGYAGSELALQGNNARTLSLGWQIRLVDIDHHFMSPPVGINRLSATLFLDAGSAWDQGTSSAPIYKGMGIELNAASKLFYRLPVPLSLGIAHGFDLNSGNRLYFKLGQTF